MNSLPSQALTSQALQSQALLCNALTSHALPSRALKLISDYSKPLTRPDWRTFIRTLSKKIFLKEIQKLNNCNTLGIYTIVNKYDYIYAMTAQELNEYKNNQKKIKIRQLELNLKKEDFIFRLEQINEKRYLRRTIKNY
jgi:hypothetical protein